MRRVVVVVALTTGSGTLGLSNIGKWERNGKRQGFERSTGSCVVQLFTAAHK